MTGREAISVSMRSINSILLAAVVALASTGGAGAVELTGKVTAVVANDVTVSFDGAQTPAVGDIILLSSQGTRTRG